MHEDDGKPSTWRQVLSCFAVYHFSMTLGASSGFSGVALPQLQDEKVTGFTLTESQVSWFASLQTFAMIPTCVLGGAMGQYIGRKYSLMLIAPLFSSGFICQAVASDHVLLLFGRFVCGAAGGLACGPTATYISEASTPSLRTSFGSGISGSYNLGMLTIFTLGAFCHWRVLAWVSAFLPLMGLLWLCLIPESPAWFVTQGRYYEAKKSLTWLRGEDCDNTKEFLDLKESYQVKDESGDSSVMEKILDKLKQLTRPDVSKPFCIILITSFLQQFSGMSSISYYAVIILSEAGSSINIYLATILYGLVRFVSQVVGSFLLIKFQRRHLLVVSCLFVSLSMAMLGAASYLHEKYHLESALSTSTKNQTVFKDDDPSALPPAVVTLIGVLPLISVCLAAFMYHIGLGPIPWSYMGGGGTGVISAVIVTYSLHALPQTRTRVIVSYMFMGCLVQFKTLLTWTLPLLTHSTLIAELFPLDVRSFMSGVGNCTSNLYIFLAVKTFPSMTHAMTMAGVYWFYSSVSIVTILFTCFCLPETKDKAFNEISMEFSKRNDSSREENAKNLPKFEDRNDSTKM